MNQSPLQSVHTSSLPRVLPSAPRRLRALTLAAMAGLLSVTFAATAAPQVSAQDSDAAQVVDDGPVVDLNTATEAELVSLPGIGPSKAQAIIARRERRAFRRVEEIMHVRGIGRATFRKLRSRLRVGER